MTSYNSHVGDNWYHIRFETDNKEHYERVQQVIRNCIDGKPPQKERTVYTPAGSVALVFPGDTPEDVVEFITAWCGDGGRGWV